MYERSSEEETSGKCNRHFDESFLLCYRIYMQNFQMKLNGYKKNLLSRICYTKFQEAWTKKIFLVAQKQIKPHTFSYLIEVIKLCIDEFNWLRGSNFSTFLQQQKSFCVDSLIRLSFNYNNFIVFDNSPIFSWFY